MLISDFLLADEYLHFLAYKHMHIFQVDSKSEMTRSNGRLMTSRINTEKYLENHLPQYCFVQYKSYMNWLGIEPGPSEKETNT